jgi:LPXTG-motif cell wall-anchored protein
MESFIIQTSEVLINNVPYMVIVGVLLIGLLILLSLRGRKEKAETANCPHCFGEVQSEDSQCRHCDRKISNPKR